MLTLELQRLDAMFCGFWKQAENGDPVAVGGCLKIMEHRARLLGLFDSPPQEVKPRLILYHAHEYRAKKEAGEISDHDRPIQLTRPLVK